MSDKKTLLITGGAGYLGSHAVVAFEQAGFQTVIVDNLMNSSRDSLSGIEKILSYCPDFYECDIGDRKGLENIFAKYTFDGVIHFAGLKAVGESCRDISRYHSNNVGGSMMLFSVMEQYGVKKIIFSSSATVYREDNPLPYLEDMALGTTNPYGTTKLVIEKLLEDYARNGEWSVTALRYFNPIGAHTSGYIGEMPQGKPNNLLPYILDVAVGKREKVFIFGDDYDTPDGTGVRDYIDVNDLIDAHILAYEKLTEGYHAYNVGTGKGTSVLEMIVLVSRVTGKEISYEKSTRRFGDIGCFYCDPTLIHTVLGWRAKRSIIESLETVWKFTRDHS